MSKRLQQIIIVAAPLLVGSLNLTHPMFSPPVYAGIIHHISWWIRLHILNLALFPFLGFAAYLLVRNVHNSAASIAKVALAVFVPIYAAFDALAGIGTGVLVYNAQHLAPNDLMTVGPLIDSYWSSSAIYVTAAVGSMAWVIAMLSAAVAFTNSDGRRKAALVAVVLFLAGGYAQTLFPRSSNMSIPIAWWLITIGMGLLMLVVARPRIPAALLVLSASLFGASHVIPTGPLGMLCFLGAAIYLMFIAQEEALIPPILKNAEDLDPTI